MEGANKRSIGNNSSLPAIIENVNTRVENPLNPIKLLVGPMVPRPGPMLLIVAVTAVNAVVRSVTYGSSEISKSTPMHGRQKKTKYVTGEENRPKLTMPFSYQQKGAAKAGKAITA